jgi:hypothetical protein
VSRWKNPQNDYKQEKFTYGREGGEKMNRIRKGLAALLAAVFFLGIGGVAQAVIGIADDVPASTLLYPFFNVNPDRTETDTQDTLIVVTNTAGATTSTQSGVAPNIAVHFTIWSVASQHIYNFSVVLTPHDVFSCSLYDLIVGGTGCRNGATTVGAAPPQVADALKVGDALTGYVTADLVYAPTSDFPGVPFYPFVYGNILIGHMYLVNLIQGSSTGFNAVSIESARPCFGQNAVPDVGAVTVNAFGFYRTRCADEQGAAACATVAPAAGVCRQPAIAYSDYTERLDGPSGDFAQTGTAGGFVGGAIPDSPLGLIVRYLSIDALNASSQLFSWRDRAPAATSLNVAVYDDAENSHSVTFTVSGEVSTNTTDAIVSPGVPDGWFRVRYPCGSFGSCAYNYATPPGAGTTPPQPPIQSVAFSVQNADDAGAGTGSDATLRWDATFPAHRQYTSFIGGSSAE